MSIQISSRVLEVISRNMDESDGSPAVELETRLFGEDAVIDSLTLVNIIVDLEEMLENDFGVQISLTDDEAVFREPSPYTSAQSLITYIEELINNQKG